MSLAVYHQPKTAHCTDLRLKVPLNSMSKPCSATDETLVQLLLLTVAYDKPPMSGMSMGSVPRTVARLRHASSVPRASVLGRGRREPSHTAAVAQMPTGAQDRCLTPGHGRGNRCRGGPPKRGSSRAPRAGSIEQRALLYHSAGSA